ncbi:MAG: glycosyltransferase family 4 protein [Promethearchaeota archaeon]
MNICFLAPNIPYNAPHAGFSHTYNVCLNLKNDGNKVVTIFNGAKFKIFKKDDMIIITVPDWGHQGAFSIHSMLKTFLKIPTLLKICKKYRIDLIHERSGLPRGMGIIAAKLLGIKSIVELNDPFIEEYDLKLKLIFRFWRILMFNLSNRILTQTPILKKILSKDAPSEKIKIISNGVDLTKFDTRKLDGSKIRRKYKIGDQDVVALFVGAFQPWHGVQNIVKIARDVKKHGCDMKFLLVGDGKLYKTVEDRIKSEKMTDDVILVGPVEYQDVPEYYAAADVGLAPFDIKNYPPLVKYGFWWCPVKIFEYLAMEKPIISINAGIIPIIAPHQKAGLLSSPDDYDGIISNLIRLANSPELRTRYGKFGRKHVIRNFSWKKIGKKISEMYKCI